MATPEEQKYEKLKSIFKMVTESITKEEFISAFEVLRARVDQMVASNAKDFKLMHESIVALSEKLRNDAAVDVEGVRTQVLLLWDAQEQKIQDRLDAIDTKVAAIKEGEDGEDGHTPTDAELLALMKPLIVEATPTIDAAGIAQLAEKFIVNNLAKYGERFRDALELLPEGQKLTPDAIEGLTAALDASVQRVGTRAGWGAHPITIQQNGSSKAKNARNLNFIGPQIALTPSGVLTIQIPIQTTAPLNPKVGDLWIDST